MLGAGALARRLCIQASGVQTSNGVGPKLPFIPGAAFWCGAT